MSGRQRVVLVGGGALALDAYALLAQRRRRAVRQGGLEIVVITPHEHLSLPGFVREVVAGILPLAATRVPLRDAMPRAVVIPAMVTYVDRLRRVVTYARLGAAGSGAVERLRYDELVVDGGRLEASTLPGLPEHGFTLRGSGDLGRLLARLRLLETSAPPALTDVVVVHNGLESEKLAVALAERPGPIAGRRVHLVPPVPAGTGRVVSGTGMRYDRDLERLGVLVHRHVHLTAVGRHHAALSDGRLLPTALVLATGRPRSVPLAGLESLPADPRRPSELALAPGVWAAGDGLGPRLLAALSGSPSAPPPRLRLTVAVRDRLGAGRRPATWVASSTPRSAEPPVRYAAVTTRPRGTARPSAAAAA